MFKISAVLPLYRRTISPGRYDSLPGIFSTDGIIPTTLIESFNSETAFIIPKTVQPPHLSNFISSILSPGFNEIPPVSKVTAFPTSTTGLSFRFPLLCSKMISFGSFLLPLPTAEIPPNPFFLSSSFEIILHFSLFLVATAFAKLASLDGEQSFGGRLAILLAYMTPWETISAFEIIF